MNIDKNKILNFIKRYNLNGEVQTVRWVIVKNVLSIKFTLPDESLRGEVIYDKFMHENSNFVIYETDPLLKMISTLDDTFEFNILPDSLKMKDKYTKLKYILADNSLANDVKNVHYPKEVFKLELTEEILGRFSKSLSTFNKCDVFGLTIDELESKLILSMREGATISLDESNISEEKSNTINIELSISDPGIDVSKLNFNSKTFKSIIDVNKGFKSCTLNVFKLGMLEIIFNHSDDMICYYQLVALQK